MKWAVFGIVLLLGFSVYLGVDAAKPYKCTDHYSYAYCLKIHAVANVTKPTPAKTPSTVSTPTTVSTPSIQSIPSADLKTRLHDLNIELLKLKDKVADNIKKIGDTLIIFDTATNSQKLANANHVNYPSETARLALVEAGKNLATAKKNYDEAKLVKKNEDARMDSINKEIQQLDKQFKDAKKTEDNTYKEFNSVGVNLSATCIILLKNNMTTTCPDYRTVLALNLDNSHKYSGNFSYYDGYFHRNKALVKNDYTLYDFGKYNIIIDPSHSVKERIRMITIQPNFNSYLLIDDMHKSNNTRIVHKDRYVDSCNQAYINADTWLETLSDTINYLRGGCTGTLLNTLDEIHDNVTKQHIDTSSKWKHDKWLEQVKKTYKVSHIGSNENGTNRSVTTMGDEK
mgnify:CR=1 FL=1